MTEPTIYKGLVGVYADVSAVSKVMPETNSLTYRGYAVQDLCEEASFDEVAYLRFASVYQAFENLDDFEAAIVQLRAEHGNAAAAADAG